MNYLEEWSQSCVDDELIRLNVVHLQGDRALDYLLYSDELPRRNDGRLGNHILQRYQHTEDGGWWCSGVDLLTGEDDLWGCFKPENPRISQDKGKYIKYEHPPQADAGIFALRVPGHLWEKIAQRYNVSLNQEEIAEKLGDFGFWDWLLEHPEIPLCLTEGAKKAGALLTAGYCAIALPGVNGGYRTPKDEYGNRIGKSHLIPQLQKLAANKREIYFVFDQDKKPNTIKAVNAAIRKTGYLLTQLGSPVKVISWNPDLGKGVDDLISNHGQICFEKAYQGAFSLDIWKANQLTRLTYPAQIEVNRRYLDDLVSRKDAKAQKGVCPIVPGLHQDRGWVTDDAEKINGLNSDYNDLSCQIPNNARLIGIKSPKGTGKTEFLSQIVKKALQNNQKVLVIGHRIRLVEELCQRFGLPYITEINQNQANSSLGYGLCIDSLHPLSQAQFNPHLWSDSLIIIDEIEQVLWHGLHSSTCKDHRVNILKCFKILMQNVLGGEGQVYAADADLSDISLDYLISLAGIDVKPFIIQNHWLPTPEEAWQVYNYPDTTPKKLVKDLEKHIKQGGKPFVCLSAQKIQSKWGTCTLEAYLQQQFPEAKILRIDSESLADPGHPAYGCIKSLNQILPNYDIVLASPVIETGVSIDVKGHFTSVWCIAQGIQAVNSVCQALSRIRENIPRYLWIAKYGFNQVGNGATSIPALLTSGEKLTQLNIRLLQQSDFEALDDLDTGFQAESLLGWAKMAVRVNALMINYRESVLAALREEGHIVEGKSQKLKGKSKEQGETEEIQAQTATSSQLSTAIGEIRDQNYHAECDAIATSTPLNEQQYQTIRKRLMKTVAERRQIRRYELQKRYGIGITAELVIKDDKGWYQQLRLHYFLTLGRCYLSDRDTLVAKWLIEQGNGSIFQPDFNHSQLGAIIGTMEILGIPVLLQNPNRELHNQDQELQQLAAIALKNRSAIKTVIGIGLAANSTPIMIIRRFLDQIGYSLQCTRTATIERKRVRIYQIVTPEDERYLVFRHWLAIDSNYPGSSAFWQEDLSAYLAQLSQSQEQETTAMKYTQLSLGL